MGDPGRSGVYSVRAHELLEDLRQAQSELRLDRRMRVYLAPKILIIDEFGVWPYDRTAATALFALISARYERGSVILTSNKGLAEWGDVLGESDHRDGDSGSPPAPLHDRQYPRG